MVLRCEACFTACGEQLNTPKLRLPAQVLLPPVGLTLHQLTLLGAYGVYGSLD